MFVEKRKNDFMNPLAQGDCPVCGGNDFEWGRLGGQVGYYPGTEFWKVAMPRVVMARRCLKCNNLLSFVDEEMTSQRQKLMILVFVGAVGIALLIMLLVFALG